MNSAKKEDNDDCVTSKIPKMSKSPSKTVNSTNKLKHVDNIEAKKTGPVGKNMLTGTKKPCLPLINLITKSSEASQLASSRSNLNTQRSAKRMEPTPRSKMLDKTSGKIQKSATERVLINNSIKAFESIKDKVISNQTEFLRRWESVKDELNHQQSDFKLMCVIEKNENKLLVKNPENFKIKCAQKPLEDFKNDMQTHIKSIYQLYLNSLDDVKNSSGKIGDSTALNAIEDIKTKLKIDNVMGDTLKLFDNLIATGNTSDDLEAKVVNLTKEIEELQLNNKELSKSNKMKRTKSEDDEMMQKLDCFEKDKVRLKKIEEELKDRSAKCDDLTRKLETSTKLKDTFQAKVEQQQKVIDKINGDLSNVLKNFEKQTTKNQEHERKIIKLEADLDAAKRELDKKPSTETDRINGDISNVMKDFEKQTMKNQEHERKIIKLEADLDAARSELNKKPSTEDQATKHAADIKALNLELTNAIKVKDQLSMEVQHLKKETEMLSKMSVELSKSKKEIQVKEEQNQNVLKDFNDLNEQLQSMKSQILDSKDIREELSNLKNVEIENNHKIENLELLLTKTSFRNSQLEEKIAMDRKLLKLRSSLIESLQSKETNQKVRLDNLFVDVGGKNCEIQMLKTEVLTKTEEFQDLFSTLKVKQLELNRQEHTIKLLKESNDRAETNRIRQESKIGRLEEEVAHLKQTISVYQDAVLSTTMSNSMKPKLLTMESGSHNEPNECLDYYVDERRKKRHIDIKIKKYEK